MSVECTVMLVLTVGIFFALPLVNSATVPAPASVEAATVNDKPACLPLDNNDVFIARTGNYAEALSEHALQCHDERNYTAAIIDWKKSISLRNNDAYLHLALGVDYEKTGNNQRAVAEWKKGLAIGIKDGAKIPSRSNQEFISKNYTAAFNSIGDIITGDDTSGPDYNRGYFADQGSPPYLNSAVDLLEKGEISEAIKPLKKAVTLSPDFYPAHLLLGDARYVLGDIRGAIDDWEQTLFSFSPEPQVSGFYSSHWAAVEMLIHYVPSD